MFSNENISIYEDYAHHPVEVRAAICAVKGAYPNRKLAVIFQPHRYARLKKYLEEFTAELKKADIVFLLPVFSAWSSINKISSNDLADCIGQKAVAVGGTWKEAARNITSRGGFETLLYDEKHIILILGAGDVNKITPEIIGLLSKRKQL